MPSYRDIKRDAEPEPEQKLAAAVLALAVADARSVQPLLRKRATLWLLHASSAVRFWCEIAGIDAVAFRERVRRELAPGDAGDGDLAVALKGAQARRTVVARDDADSQTQTTEPAAVHHEDLRLVPSAVSARDGSPEVLRG